ncbi:MAG TPA: neutral/alkaline non-lysosomal ceramidase N-terminal domain-containing protein [Vicinamibacterales bacterium]|nr:neutral/alkaline non-lysosomal ceramidase N-terminal domain-containing protein [Vicinamibacterales bacterium]HPW21814.1 neutral/alkaline non-lysosomal ceramidase N-terminal domain-containing protein [Vicinamibacterales bacterium]
MHRRSFLWTLASAAAFPGLRASTAWRAGLASIDITPPLGLWMGGFAARTEPARGIALPLHAKALALEDAAGRRAVVVTLDLLGLTDRVAERIAAAVGRRYGVPREGLLLCSSHTHSGPVIDDQLAVAYDLSPSQWEDIRASTRRIEGQVLDVVGRALDALAPAHLRRSQGEAGFGANRRVAFEPPGPVDPAVPVLAVERPGGRLAGLLFGYACHNTTLVASFVQYHGDYAGVAQAELERRHPGAIAMFVQGCGADANPKPRGTRELAEQHGRTLADAVERALGGGSDVRGPLRRAFGTVTLPYAQAPGAEDWRRKLEDANVYVRRHAKLMLDDIARDGRTRAAEAVPLHVLALGQSLFIGIGGEVVADYALALKRKYGDATWVAGYVDAVFGYLPSLRVLREGGYEGADAMLYFGRPGPFSEAVEDTVMAGLDGLVARAGALKGRLP